MPDKPANREKTGQFKKGASGNPTGRPKAHFELVDKCRDMTPEALEQVKTVLQKGKGMERLKAAEILLAYGWGKPTQRTEVTGADGGPIEQTFILPKEVADLID